MEFFNIARMFFRVRVSVYHAKKKFQNYDKPFVDSNMFQIIRYAENVCHDRKFFTKKKTTGTYVY